ncbi:hypothetical protein P7K49_029051, partial [Saguinus oedipus]
HKGEQHRTKTPAAAAGFGAQGRPRPPGAPAAPTALRGRPGARLCLRRCRRPGMQEAGAIVRPELDTAHPEARRRERPSVARSSAGTLVSSRPDCLYRCGAFSFVY